MEGERPPRAAWVHGNTICPLDAMGPSARIWGTHCRLILRRGCGIFQPLTRLARGVEVRRTWGSSRRSRGDV
jgi:hypothetical protein